MKLILIRRWFGKDKTLSRLYINGRLKYFALEDLVRREGEKVLGQTAIPYGKYPVTIHYWPKHSINVPLINNVPNFSGILIHAGIDESWTEGCVLISRKVQDGKLVLDKEAVTELSDSIRSALDSGEKVTIHVINYQRRAMILFGITSVLAIIAIVAILLFTPRK